MRIRLSSPAEAELAETLEWYAAIGAGLAVRFLDEYESLLKRLSANPWQFPTAHGPVRRARLRHFPYGLFYRIHPAEVEIVACLHASRDPQRWQDRV